MDPDELVNRLKAAAAKAPPGSALARALAATYCSQYAREAQIVALGPSMG